MKIKEIKNYISKDFKVITNKDDYMVVLNPNSKQYFYICENEDNEEEYDIYEIQHLGDRKLNAKEFQYYFFRKEYIK